MRAQCKDSPLDLTADEKQNAALWISRSPLGTDGDNAVKDSEAVSDRFVGLVEALRTLVATSTSMYKERYEGSSSSSSSSRGRHEAGIRDEAGLTEAGKRLKRVMRKRFKYVDGQEYFEKDNGEWVKTTEDPVGLCKTCRSRGEVMRH